MQNLKALTYQIASTQSTESREISLHIKQLSRELQKTLQGGFALTPGNMYNIARASSLINAYRKTGNRWIPRPLLITQPKSGTKHVENYLINTFNYLRLTPTYGYHVHNREASFIRSVFFKESEFLFGSKFISYHLCASRALFSDIQNMNLDTIILLRHPIQTLVSHYHYLTTGERRNFNTKHTLQPGQYFGPYNIKSHNDIRNFLINIVYPRIISFVDEWMTAINSRNTSLKMTLLSHEQLALNPDLFHNKIACAIGEERGEEWKNYELITNHNFRSGKTDEWKDFFTKDEREKIAKPCDKLITLHKNLGELFML